VEWLKVEALSSSSSTEKKITNWDKIFANHISERELICRI
jgi:hypothetical protein